MATDPLIGTLLSERYRVERALGTGAMGRVYLAEHVHMRKLVALKVLHRELTSLPELVQRFEREAQTSSSLVHPHIVAATDFGRLEDGSLYLVLEYVEGQPLRELIAQGPVALARVLDIAAQVCSALELAHQQGVVHRDLKPDNLLLLAEHEIDFVKILDFGVAKILTQSGPTDKPLTQAGAVYGTAEYMAPEQALGQTVDGRADIYALGVVMFEMLTGRRPYLGPAAGLVGQQLSQPLPRMGQVADVKIPASVEQLVIEMLASDASKRISDVTQVHAQLNALSEALAQGTLQRTGSLLSSPMTERLEQVSRNIPQPVKKAVRSRQSRAAVVGLGFGVVGVAVAIAAVGAFSQKKSREVVEAQTAPVVTAVEVQTDSNERIELVQKIEQAKAKGLTDLIALSKQLPTEGLVQAELAQVLAQAHRYTEALDAVRQALALDPQLNESEQVIDALFRAAQSQTGRSAAFRMLTGPMGSAGVNIIYDLARADGVNKRAKAYAQQLLASEDVRAIAPPEVTLLIELEQTRDCSAVSQLVQKAPLVGDKRALPLLHKLQERSGCGAGKNQDCYPCLRENDLLKNAILTIEERATLTPSK